MQVVTWWYTGDLEGQIPVHSDLINWKAGLWLFELLLYTLYYTEFLDKFYPLTNVPLLPLVSAGNINSSLETFSILPHQKVQLTVRNLPSIIYHWSQHQTFRQCYSCNTSLSHFTVRHRIKSLSSFLDIMWVRPCQYSDTVIVTSNPVPRPHDHLGGSFLWKCLPVQQWPWPWLVEEVGQAGKWKL